MKLIVIAWAVSLSAASASAAFSPSDQPILFELSVKRNRVEVRPGGSRDQSFFIDPSVYVRENDLLLFSDRWSIDEDTLHMDGVAIGRDRMGRMEVDTEGRGLTIRIYDRGNSAPVLRRKNNVTGSSPGMIVEAGRFVRGYVLNFGGDITVEGEVNRSVVSIGGDVEITETGVVRGSVISLGGDVHKAEKAKVYGDLYSNNRKRFRPRWYRDPDQNAVNLSLRFQYNRVTGALPWATLVVGPDKGSAPTLQTDVGYAFETELWHYKLGLGRSQSRGPNYYVGWRRDARSDHMLSIGRDENTIYALMFREDFGDYYFAEGFEARAGWAFGRGRMLRIEYANNLLSPLVANRSQWSLFGGPLFSPNYARLQQAGLGDAEDFTGRLVYLLWQFSFQSTELDDYREGHWRISLTAEVSDPSLESDFDYTRVYGSLLRNQPLWNNQSIRLRVFSGRSNGALPAMRQFYLGGLGSLRGYSHNEFFGDRVWLTNLEYVWSLDSWQIFALADAGQAGQGSTWTDGPVRYDLGIGIGIQESLRLQIAWAAAESDRSPFVTARFSRPF